MHTVEPNSKCLSYNAHFNFAIHPKNQVLNSKIVGSVFVYRILAPFNTRHLIILFPTRQNMISDRIIFRITRQNMMKAKLLDCTNQTISINYNFNCKSLILPCLTQEVRTDRHCIQPLEVVNMMEL